MAIKSLAKHPLLVLMQSCTSLLHCFVPMVRIQKIPGFGRTFFFAISPSLILPSWRRKRWQVMRWRRHVRGCPARHSMIIRWHSTLALSRISFSVDAATNVTRRITRWEHCITAWRLVRHVTAAFSIVFTAIRTHRYSKRWKMTYPIEKHGQTSHLPVIGHSADCYIHHRVCDAWQVWCQTYGYLPSQYFHPAEDRRLSWPEWLVTYQNGLIARVSSNWAWHRVTLLMLALLLPLSWTTSLCSAMYTVSQKTSHLWLAVISMHMNGFWFFLAEMLPIK